MIKETDQSLKLEYEPVSISEVFNLIEKIKKKLDQLQRYVLRETNLTPPQYSILNVLPEKGGYQLSELASTSHCSRSTMTSLIDTMEKKGLVRREPNPKDRRSILVTLTEKGKTLREAAPTLNRIFGTCCSGLEHDELQKLGFLLKKLEASLKIDDSCDRGNYQEITQK